MNRQQVEMAVGAGLELLGDNSDIAIPAKLLSGTFLLKQLLLAIGQGQMGLTPTAQTPPQPELTPVDPSIDPPGEPEEE